MSNVKNIFIGGKVCREFKPRGTSGRRNVRPHRMQQRTVLSFQMCLVESSDCSGTFRNWRQKVTDRWCHDSECLGVEIDPWHIYDTFML